MQRATVLYKEFDLLIELLEKFRGAYTGTVHRRDITGKDRMNMYHAVFLAEYYLGIRNDFARIVRMVVYPEYEAACILADVLARYCGNMFCDGDGREVVFLKYLSNILSSDTLPKDEMIAHINALIEDVEILSCNVVDATGKTRPLVYAFLFFEIHESPTRLR